jgi:pyrrolidone-carboxylate peptidase
MSKLELSSRGMESVSFATGSADKKILISGFDPFGLDASGDVRRGNPSGAAVLALDGTSVSAQNVSGHVEGVVFPVRFADFNAGVVEQFFTPFISGPNRVDMIMTISQGGSTAFEVERWAARRRTTQSDDNLGAMGGPAATTDVETPNVGTGAQFTRTSLPEGALRTALGRTTPLSGEVEFIETPQGGGAPVRHTSPTDTPGSGSTAVSGSGGDYLSNEIFYRTTRLRDAAGVNLPMGHLHTPLLGLPGQGVSDAAFVAARDAMVATVRTLLAAALPSI